MRSDLFILCNGVSYKMSGGVRVDGVLILKLGATIRARFNAYHKGEHRAEWQIGEMGCLPHWRKRTGVDRLLLGIR